jgi:hypothetical protein
MHAACVAARRPRSRGTNVAQDRLPRARKERVHVLAAQCACFPFELEVVVRRPEAAIGTIFDVFHEHPFRGL